jgi:hypothetical protein
MIKEEHERMRALWRRHGLSDELYRRFMMYLLNQRSQGMDSTATAHLCRLCPQCARVSDIALTTIPTRRRGRASDDHAALSTR